MSSMILSTRTSFIVVIFFLIGIHAFAQKTSNVTLAINTKKGHSIMQGCNGLNERIGDKIWNYQHPEFIKVVNELKPGWLRYWSGTAGDAFSMGTGAYDEDYVNMFDEGESYDKLYQYSEVKGPSRIIDLYHLMGSIGGRIVVTVNAFTEKPEMTAELARFCKNNHIKVEAWQFCNEPYFYIPSRQRYWWNDGYDYAQKMKPHADSIIKIFPDAKLALNFTWDGIMPFMKDINRYQKENGAFWNVFSKHSYAPHTGKEESLEEALKRMNTKLVDVTSDKAMQEIESWTHTGIPMLITEFGVWNKPLNGISAAIYNAEYVLRQLSHPNTWMIAAHEISNKIKPIKNYTQQISDAYKKGTNLNTDALTAGMVWDDEGRALALVNEATNNSNYIWQSSLSGEVMVDGMDNKQVPGMYATAFRGTGSQSYIMITNRSAQPVSLSVNIDGEEYTGDLECHWIAGTDASTKNVTLHRSFIKSGKIVIAPFSVTLMLKKNDTQQIPPPSRIYDAVIKKGGVNLRWWPVQGVKSYLLKCKDLTSGQLAYRQINGKSSSYLMPRLALKHRYEFTVWSVNNTGKSSPSESITLNYNLPERPSIFKVALRDSSATVFWHSVPDAQGYKISIYDKNLALSKTVDAKNVYGYKLRGLKFDRTYTVSVSAYNGLGEGIASIQQKIICKKNIPLPPKNISAHENDDQTVALKWLSPQKTTPGTLYRLYRSEKIYDFKLLTDGIADTSYVDATVKQGHQYFYTVKSYTSAGECNYYPNVASVIRINANARLNVLDISKNNDQYIVKVAFENLNAEQKKQLGVLISNVSYLNGEEVFFRADTIDNNYGYIRIPVTKFQPKSMYIVKAAVQSKAHGTLLSLPPYAQIKTE